MDENIFEWLFARRKAGHFIEWAAQQDEPHFFSYETLKRAKKSITTSRHKLMAKVAERYRSEVEQRTVEAA